MTPAASADRAAEPLPTRREDLLARLAEPIVYDLAVVGGGATGLGVALDAALRGYRVLLLEAHDFAKGTSSRSTKLVHGGVRYLAQGQLPLVWEALHERSRLLANAPHLAQPLPFIIPGYRWWEPLYYGLGLKLYDALAGRSGLGPTRLLSAQQTLAALPGLRAEHLQGSVRYWDGQFNDARLAIALARTAAKAGALLVNYCQAKTLRFEQGKVVGCQAVDAFSGRTFEVRARCVINATGVWVDGLRAQDSDGKGHAASQPLVSPSQGVHLVVDRDFLPGEAALMVPRTADGRVLFAVPWLGKVILGTTDTPREDAALEPRPLTGEVDFILREAGRYLSRPPTRQDVRSAWVGLRPLVRTNPPADATQTGRMSREHVVRISASGLVSVTGGKWTTYRAMAEDVMDHCQQRGLLPRRDGRQTEVYPLIGAHPPSSTLQAIWKAESINSYGSEAEYVLANYSGSTEEWAPGLSEAVVRFAARHEFACTVEDVLARRSRLLFLDAMRALDLAPRVAAVLEEETGRDPRLVDFQALARCYASPGA